MVRGTNLGACRGYSGAGASSTLAILARTRRPSVRIGAIRARLQLCAALELWLATALPLSVRLELGNERLHPIPPCHARVAAAGRNHRGHSASRLHRGVPGRRRCGIVLGRGRGAGCWRRCSTKTCSGHLCVAIISRCVVVFHDSGHNLTERRQRRKGCSSTGTSTSTGTGTGTSNDHWGDDLAC